MGQITRSDVARRLDRIHSEVSLLAAEIERLKRELANDVAGRDYDAHPEAPESIAAKFGIELDVPGEIPEWVRERTAQILGER
jgi:hypothetical protein